MGSQRGVVSAAAVLDAPEESHSQMTGAGSTELKAPTAGLHRRGGDPNWRAPEPAPAGALQRGYAADATGANGPSQEEEDEYQPRRGARGTRVNLRGLLRSTGGRIVLATVALVLLSAVAVGFVVARSYVLHDPRFLLASSDDIQISGNAHLSREQLLSVFGGDLERSIFRVSLAERRADLERLPWVEHATVMRLLPNRLRVEVKERTPVAFVRQGTQIGLVAANGVLLDMATDASADAHYSFPVLTGIAAGDPLSTRAARMEIYGRFMKDLDGTGKGLSRSVSEVDVTDPEDVKALILPPTGGGNSEVLVHFGDEQFLARYNEFERHLPEWKQQYPMLASADMRYDGQIVLEMRKDAGAAAAPADLAAVPSSNAGLSTPASTSSGAGREERSLGSKNAKVLPVSATVKDVAKGKAPAKKAAAKPAVKKVAAKKVVAKKVAGKSAAGKSAANERMYAALAAQRKAAEAHPGGTR